MKKKQEMLVEVVLFKILTYIIALGFSSPGALNARVDSSSSPCAPPKYNSKTGWRC